MQTARNTFLGLVVMISVSACGDLHRNTNLTKPVLTSASETQPAALSIDGVVHFNDVEGGSFVIWADNHETYFPVNLDKALQVEGLKIHIEARKLRDTYSSTMNGTIVQIDAVNIVE